MIQTHPITPPPITTLASRLVATLGERAIAHCRMRRVEMIAADHRFGARFWLSVMAACEQELARRRGDRPGTGQGLNSCREDHPRGLDMTSPGMADQRVADQRAAVLSAPR